MSTYSGRYETSSPLSICDGFALFPDIGQARAGKTWGDKNTKLLDKEVKAAIYKFRGYVGVQLFTGVCGPGYAVGFDVDGEIVPDGEGGTTVSAAVSNDEVQGGMLMGVVVTPKITLHAEKLGWDWGPVWRPVLKERFEYDIDVINLLIKVIKKIMGKKNEDSGVAETNEEIGPKLKTSYGLFDKRTGKFSERDVFDIEPKITLDWNIITLIPQLKAILEVLKKISSELSTGPSLTFSIPVDIRINKLAYSGSESLTDLSFSHGELTKTETQVSDGADLDTVEMRHSPGFDIKLGWFFKVQIIKIISFTPRIDFSIISLLGIEIRFGTYYNNLDRSGAQIGRNDVEIILAPKAA